MRNHVSYLNVPSHPRLFCISRPRTFMWSTAWRVSPPSESCGSWTGLFKQITCMTWHFDGLGGISLTLHQLSKASRWYWSLWEFVLALHTSAKVRSSTNFHRSGVVSAASLTITKKWEALTLFPVEHHRWCSLNQKVDFVLNALSTIWQETADRWNYRRPHSRRDDLVIGIRMNIVETFASSKDLKKPFPSMCCAQYVYHILLKRLKQEVWQNTVKRFGVSLFNTSSLWL